MSIDIWWVNLEADTGGLDDLSAQEQQRYWRFQTDTLRRRYLASHVALHRILALYVDKVEFVHVSDGKKPRLVGSDICFSLSHSHDAAVVAVARSVEIGVDVEKERANVNVFGVAQRYFSTDELEELKRTPVEKQTAKFFAMWTAREAYLKAKGVTAKHVLDEH